MERKCNLRFWDNLVSILAIVLENVVAPFAWLFQEAKLICRISNFMAKKLLQFLMRFGLTIVRLWLIFYNLQRLFINRSHTIGL
jgi:hypothetical protein